MCVKTELELKPESTTSTVCTSEFCSRVLDQYDNPRHAIYLNMLFLQFWIVLVLIMEYNSTFSYLVYLLPRPLDRFN